MSKLNEEWKVEKHGPIDKLADGLYTVAGEIDMPLGHFPRRMTIVALQGGGLAVWSAIPLHEPEMEQLESMGPVQFLIVPGVGHRLDIKPWKQRYPAAKVVCPPGAREAVEQAVEVDATTDVLGDPTVAFMAVPGVEEKEAALVIRRADGTTLVVNDIIANVRHPDGLGAKVMARLMGFGVKEPQMPWVGEKMFVKDHAAVAAALRTWAAEPGLARIVVSHGDVITDQPHEVLEKIAADVAE
ncbi:hypothetical protein [Variovorax sp. KK3]|uniref:hypothetical protein n=1 Tax=Variovorax sp. KK3 TaxID=1855728 RepID=UPI00097BD05B|nr:hypothetical protein [Variovorax sp. KK3]